VTDLDVFSFAKQFTHVGQARVAYRDEGTGPPVVLLHGCPFSSPVWRNVLPALTAAGHRVRAPDLLGLGDTETPLGADWSLSAQAATIVGWLDVLGLDRVSLVGHDHGGAVAQLLAAQCPERFDRLVLCNVEAYDNWPSSDERPFITATQLSVVDRVVLWAWSRPALLRWAFRAGHAVADRSVLTGELARGYVRANLSDPTSGPRPAGSSPARSTPPTTKPPRMPSMGCAASSGPPFCCGAVTTPTSDARGLNASPPTSPASNTSRFSPAPVTC
jgi:pimeloyl-ACP methyl ester carboxylesterase